MIETSKKVDEDDKPFESHFADSKIFTDDAQPEEIISRGVPSTRKLKGNDK